jgi:hypothetical protein
MFAEHAKGQPFWSQAKAEDFRRNTPWADVYALPAASTAELLSEEEAVKKEEGDIKAEEFAKAMGLLSAEPEPAAIAVLPLKGGAEDVAVIPVRSPEEVAKEEAATGVQQTFISSNTPILGVDNVPRLALEYMNDIADPNAPAPPPPMPNAPIDVTMPDNSIVKLLAAPVEEQPAAITTTMAAEEGKGATNPAPNEPVQQDAPGVLPMELPVTSIASVDGHTEVGLLQPSGTVKTLIIEQPASTLSDNNDGEIKKPIEFVGAHAQLIDPTGTTVEGTVVAVEPKLDECRDEKGKVTECVTGTIQFEDGTKIIGVPIMAGEKESSDAVLIITANGKEEKMEAKIEHNGGEARVTAEDAAGKEIKFNLPEATGELNKAPEANAADEPRIEGAQVPVVITDLNTGNVLSQSVATVKSFEHTPNQNNIHMEVPIRGVLLEMEVIVPVEKKPENSDEPQPEIIAAQVVLPGQHVPQPAAVIPPPAGVQEELRVLSGDGSNVEVQIFEHAEGTRASGTISQHGVTTPITQISSDNVVPRPDGTEILSQTFATPKGETITVQTLQSDPSVATEAPRQ